MSCLHFTKCGGCTSQHLDYAQQLQSKQEIVEKAFPGLSVKPIIPCLDPWQYRNKMEFSFSQNKAGERFLGLILRSTRGWVFNLQQCLICSPWFAETLQAVKEWWDTTDLRAFNPRSAEGTLRTLILREGKRTGDKLLMLTVSGDPRFVLSRSQIDNFAKISPGASSFLRIQQCIKGSPTQFFEMHLKGPTHIREELHVAGEKYTFKISPASFFQPNTLQAEVLYSRALEMASPTPEMHVFDLYAGTAAIGMVFARHVKKVTAIELNSHAVCDAKDNCEENQISNLEIHCGDVGKILSQLPSPDLAIVDPPRTGLDAEALGHLLRLQPKKILYISCNPQTQAENVKALTGYQVKEIQPVDQFPHTPHIENILLLDLGA